MSIKKLVIFFTANILISNSIASYAGGLERRIENNSSITWTIIAQPENENVKVIFDKPNNDRTPACLEGSLPMNGPCFLAPGQTTYMTFYTIYKTLNANLIFTDGISKVVVVKYQGVPGDLSTTISDLQKIKDDKKGNLTIFDFQMPS